MNRSSSASHLIIVLNQRLPVEFAFIERPSVIVNIVVHVIHVQALLRVDLFELLLPGNARFLRSIQVHPYEAKLIDVQMEFV